MWLSRQCLFGVECLGPRASFLPPQCLSGPASLLLIFQASNSLTIVLTTVAALIRELTYIKLQCSGRRAECNPQQPCEPGTTMSQEWALGEAARWSGSQGRLLARVVVR